MATATATEPEEAPWARYFDGKEDVVLPNGDSFRTYHAGTQGPHVVLLHGGGYTSMTWCLLTDLLKASMILHAIDFRGHGFTTTANDEDLAMPVLVEDVLAVLERIIPSAEGETDPANRPQTILVGHSLGGAVGVRVAATDRIPSLVGVMVIDVVEGTAIASLEHMDHVLAKRPRSFFSLDEAIQWAMHSGFVRNAHAAAVSVPSQLVRLADGTYGWRTNLGSTAPFWRDWFVGLSEQFLSLKAAKVLVLAGSDRLDTALMRGQMMGKFELRLLYGSGHAIQEDTPEQLAPALVDFCSRCARLVSGNIFGPSSNPTQAPPNALLAEKLARARAMQPKLPPLDEHKNM